MFCCSGFENLVSYAGDRGHSIVVWLNHKQEPCFFMQSRGFPFGDEKKFSAVDINVDVKINVSAEIGIRYCPFCGRLLEEMVNDNLSFFVDLAKQHEVYLASMPGL